LKSPVALNFFAGRRLLLQEYKGVNHFEDTLSPRVVLPFPVLPKM